MIKLSEISTENTEKFLEDTHRRMYDMLSDSERNASYERIIHYCSTEGHLDNEKIRRLLIGNISDLRDAIVNIGPIEDENDENVNVKRKFKNLYNNFCNRTLGKNWAQMLGVTVCPYCNRSYVFTSKRGTRPQYDHYFPKSKYPYLSISMYNLIPCCSICNGLKRDEDTFNTPFIYPYKDSYGKQVAFEEIGIGGNEIETWLGAADRYEVKIRYSSDIDADLKSRIKHAVDTFEIEELYSKHGDYIRDLLRTAYVYNDDYFEGLLAQYPNLFHNKQEAQNFVFLNYLNEEDWGKRVLAKLTHDMAKKAGK